MITSIRLYSHEDTQVRLFFSEEKKYKNHERWRLISFKRFAKMDGTYFRHISWTHGLSFVNVTVSLRLLIMETLQSTQRKSSARTR